MPRTKAIEEIAGLMKGLRSARQQSPFFTMVLRDEWLVSFDYAIVIHSIHSMLKNSIHSIQKLMNGPSAFRQKFPKLWTSVAHSFLQQIAQNKNWAHPKATTLPRICKVEMQQASLLYYSAKPQSGGILGCAQRHCTSEPFDSRRFVEACLAHYTQTVFTTFALSYFYLYCTHTTFIQRILIHARTFFHFRLAQAPEQSTWLFLSLHRLPAFLLVATLFFSTRICKAKWAEPFNPPPLPPPLSLSLSLSLHKLEILNWLGLNLLQSAVCFLKRCRSGSACSWHGQCTCHVQVFVTTLVPDLLYSELLHSSIPVLFIIFVGVFVLIFVCTAA